MIRKLNNYWALILLIVIFSSNTTAQQSNTLNIKEYISIIRNYHPTVLTMNIALQKADAAILNARSAFDPVINNYLSSKTIDNVNYYNFSNHSITIPTWYGIDIEAGINNNLGYKLDPSITKDQSSFVGINVDILNNFIIDKRRAQINKAKIYKDITYQDRRRIINDLLHDAVKDYWEWADAYRVYTITKEMYERSTMRYEMIQKSVINGERAGIDTIEARVQYQTLYNQMNEALLRYNNAAISINAFLWTQDKKPYQLPKDVFPASFWDGEYEKDTINLQKILLSAKETHPELNYYQYYGKVLEIERKIKTQELIPKISAYYYHYNKSYRVWDAPHTPFVNNFQYGLKTEIPIFLSKQRASLKTARLNIDENNIKFLLKSNEIENKINTYYNTFLQLQNQIKVQRQIQQQYTILLDAEQKLFSNGESSLFLINAREIKLLEAEQKLVNMITKYYKSIYDIQWSMGVL